MKTPSLADLTAAECYVLLSHRKTYYEQAMLLTVKDLSLKDVLDLREQTYTVRRGKQVLKRKVLSVFKHSNYYKYKPLPHERFVFNCLGKYSCVSLSRFFDQLYTITPSETKFGRVIIRPRLNRFFRPVNFSFQYLTPRLNASGLKLQQQLLEELNTLLDDLVRHLPSDPEESLGILKHLEGKVYMIDQNRRNTIVNQLNNASPTLRNSQFTEAIYAWFLEIERLNECDEILRHRIKQEPMLPDTPEYGWDDLY